MEADAVTRDSVVAAIAALFPLLRFHQEITRISHLATVVVNHVVVVVVADKERRRRTLSA